jgi:hypothetical protein
MHYTPFVSRRAVQKTFVGRRPLVIPTTNGRLS